MRKRILIIAMVFITVLAVTVFANEDVRERLNEKIGAIFEVGKEYLEEATDVTEASYLSELELEECAENADRFDKVAEYIGYDTYESFELLHKAALFMSKNCLTKEQFSFVEGMILDGCDVQTVMDIYEFYMTTNEDIEIVRAIYDMVWDGEPILYKDIVFENAFNCLTNNKCGVLSIEDIEDYYEKGITSEDIRTANLLSRKGVLTINEILDNMIKGESVKEIVETISGEKIKSYTDEKNEYVLISSIYNAKSENISIDTAISEIEDVDDWEKKKSEVNNVLKSKGYWKAKVSENTDAIIKMAEKKGIDKAEVMNMLDSGYDECRVLNALENEKCDAASFKETLKREAMAE